MLEEQKGLWIEDRLLRQAQLGKHLQVVVKPGKILILPAATVPVPLSYTVTEDEAQATLKEVRKKITALCGGQAPPTDRPYFGGVTWQEYQALSDEERQALWNRLYAEFDEEIDVIEERDVRPDALVAG